MARVKLERVRKVYPGNTVAVHAASFEVADGEFVVLVGPSGCGKSTTLRMVAGLESVTDGTLFIGERRVNGLSPKERDVAMVFQNYALYPHMSAYDNMAFGLKLRKTASDEIDRRVRSAARMLSIEELMERKPKALSGGQRQRVALGRAIVREPEVFLFDEPLSNLDAKLRAGMRTELQALHARLEATMLYVTHDQVEAMTMGDRIVVLDGGHVQQVATPMTLYNRPVNRFVAGFIGSPAMNLVRGTLRRESGALCFQADSGAFALNLGALPPAQRQALEASDTRAVTLGVRPEHLSLDRGEAPADTSGAAQVRAVLEVVEPMGSETVLHARPKDAPSQEEEKEEEATLVAKVDPSAELSMGQTVTLAADAENMHFFDTETDRAIRAKEKKEEGAQVAAPA